MTTGAGSSGASSRGSSSSGRHSDLINQLGDTSDLRQYNPTEVTIVTRANFFRGGCINCIQQNTNENSIKVTVIILGKELPGKII